MGSEYGRRVFAGRNEHEVEEIEELYEEDRKSVV